jgi:hypothetical protein
MNTCKQETFATRSQGFGVKHSTSCFSEESDAGLAGPLPYRFDDEVVTVLQYCGIATVCQ